MIVAVLVSAHPTEADARTAYTTEHGHGNLPYTGIWVHPTPERPLVHIFSDQTVEELRAAQWTREDA